VRLRERVASIARYHPQHSYTAPTHERYWALATQVGSLDPRVAGVDLTLEPLPEEPDVRGPSPSQQPRREAGVDPTAPLNPVGW